MSEATGLPPEIRAASLPDALDEVKLPKRRRLNFLLLLAFLMVTFPLAIGIYAYRELGTLLVVAIIILALLSALLFIFTLREMHMFQHRLFHERGLLNQANKALGESERQLRLVTDNLPALVSYIDREENYRYANATFKRIFGVEPDNMLGRKMREVKGDSYYQYIAGEIAKALRGELVDFTGQSMIGNRLYFYRSIFVPDRDETGMVRGFYAMTFDITDLKTGEMELAVSENRLRHITDNIPALISYIDKERRFRFNNHTYTEWMGKPLEEITGHRLSNVYSKAIMDLITPHIDKVFSSGKMVNYEFSLPDSNRIISGSYVPDIDDGGNVIGIYAHSHDVTEQRSLEAKVKRESLERAWLSVAEQEQERLGRELHDGIGQELSGASFLAKSLAVRLQSEGNQLAADADWVKQLLGRSVELVRSLSRQLSPIELENGNVLAAIDRLCADVERSYGVECQFVASHNARALCSAMTNNAARQIYRVCQEGLTNAMRHGGGFNISVRLELRGRMLRLSVCDDGCGFPEKSTRQRNDVPSGVGLHSMHLRAQSLNGHLRIGRHHGTTLVILRAPFGKLMFSTPEPGVHALS